MKKKVLVSLFVILYLFVGIVSTVHSIQFFEISNMGYLAVMLAVAFEVGQAAVLFTMLSDADQKSKYMPWILMGILTVVQIIGNVYASYKYMIINSLDEVKYFTDSVLFFVADPDQHYNNVMISYITGAILPIVALMLTSMVVSFQHSGDVKKSEPIETIKEEEKIEQAPKEQAPEQPKEKKQKIYI